MKFFVHYGIRVCLKVYRSSPNEVFASLVPPAGIQTPAQCNEIYDHVERLRVLLCVREVDSVINALDLLLDLVRLFDLTLPSLFRHLGLLVEHLGFWCAVAAADSVPEGGVLSVVEVEPRLCQKTCSDDCSNSAYPSWWMEWQAAPLMMVLLATNSPS